MRYVIFSICLCLAVVYTFSNVAKVVTKAGSITDFQLWAMAIGIAGVVTFAIGVW